MTPLDPQVITRRLATMRMLLDHLGRLEITVPEQLEDLALRLQVERVLSQLVNLATEINAHVAMAALDRPPESYREGFDRAVEAGFLDAELASDLKPSIGLRNILIHEYVRVDLTMVTQAVPRALSGYRDYVRQIAAALGRAR